MVTEPELRADGSRATGGLDSFDGTVLACLDMWEILELPVDRSKAGRVKTGRT